MSTIVVAVALVAVALWLAKKLARVAMTVALASGMVYFVVTHLPAIHAHLNALHTLVGR